MALIPENKNCVRTIIATRDAVDIFEPERPYLGMSGIGGYCMRALYYGFHWVVPNGIPRRVHRIFERGHWEEQRLIRDLSEIGIEFFRRDINGEKIPITGIPGEEQEQIVGFAGHALGHTDGRCILVPDAPKTEHLAEFKSANDKKFKEFVKKGVEEANQTYYGQVQRYMHGKKLKRTLWAVTNKNDESRYIERIPYVKSYAEELVKKEQHIIMSDSPPEKIGGSTWFECKWCSKKEVCHSGGEVARNCRTCDFSDLENEGKWSCIFHEKEISTCEQRVGCNMWKIGWGLK